MKLHCIAILLVVTSSATDLAHAADDATSTSRVGDCQPALQRLHAQEETQRAARRQGSGKSGIDVGAALAAARRQAAKACLGGSSDPPVQKPRLQAPLSVAPIAPGAPVGSPDQPASPAALQQRSAPPPIVSAPAPARTPLSTVTSCDSAGCWTSDGQHLMRVGPNLVGPPGLCTSTAGILTCR
ncbi:MAG: hypothetical protein ABI564_07140 [Ideonella sp.]